VSDWEERYLARRGGGFKKKTVYVKGNSLLGPRASGSSPASLACLQQYLQQFFGR